MNITDLFIRRPVLACVISLIILVLGLRAVFDLPVRQYPETQSATVMVTTTYYGANPDVVAGFITAPLEAAISQAQGIDYLSSTSSSGKSVITATLQLNYDGNRALTEINSKVNSVLNRLPPEAQQPVLALTTGETNATIYINFNSAVMRPNQITDYLVRVVQPQLQSIPGVQEARLFADRQFALRAWLDPARLAAHGLTAADVNQALRSNNYISALGVSKGQAVKVNITAGTDLHSVEEFRQLVVKRVGDQLVRLEDVANVMLGAENYEIGNAFNGSKAIAIGIFVAPDANLLEVSAAVRKVFPDIQAQLPQGLQGIMVFDATMFVNTSISEVVKTLVEALIIVTVVIFLFLGSARSVLIPVVAMPLSLIGAFIVMFALGYTINLLTLLALVLAIGLVVDDAIIVVENVDRHMKEGFTPMQAALRGARELAGPIIAISVVLIAVYVPIGFQGGLTGALFTEFSFTLAAAVAVSAVVALTLSPMMCSRLFRTEQLEGRLVRMIDHNLEVTGQIYLRMLRGALNAWPVVVVFGFIIIALILVMAKLSQSELAPEEDQGYLLQLVTAGPMATTQQLRQYSAQVLEIQNQQPDIAQTISYEGFPASNQGFIITVTKPWDERSVRTHELRVDLQKEFDKIAGARVAVLPPPALPGGGNDGLPMQFVIKTTDSFENLSDVASRVMEKAQASGKFYFLDNDLKYDKPQTQVIVDREKAATLGLTMEDIGTAMGSMLGGNYVNYFSIAGRSYRVIPQVEQIWRLNPDQITEFYLRTSTGDMVRASSVLSLKTETVPQAINHFQQLNSATISGVAGVPLGDALETLRNIAAEVLPANYAYDYAGQSRQVVSESNAFVLTLGFAILIIYLVLAAQFESFRDPLIVMMSVPMAIFGAMLFIFEGAATLNIYTEVGLVTLVGLIAKHGILIVQFANEEQKRGRGKREAVENAAAARLRPILMTTGAMVLGVLPLVLASGAGAVGRNNMGMVIATGISIGTLFTLFVVPAMYLFIGADHRRRKSAVDEADAIQV